MADQPLTTVVIVTYKSLDSIGAALDSVKTCHDAGLAECVVVDNASDDNTLQFVTENYPWVTLVESKENIGFGRGCNLGLAECETPYVMFLNPDAQVTADDLQQLHTFMEEHPRAGIISPATEFTGGGYQPIRALPTPVQLVTDAARLTNSQQRNREVTFGEESFQTDWLCGAILLGRRELLDELGGFDPRFFLYFEETDLCVRTIEQGYELWLVADAHSTHEAGASAKSTGEETVSGCVANHYYQSRYYFLAKHYGRWPTVAAQSFEWLLLAGRWIVSCCLGKNSEKLRQQMRLIAFRPPAEPQPTESTIHPTLEQELVF